MHSLRKPFSETCITLLARQMFRNSRDSRWGTQTLIGNHPLILTKCNSSRVFHFNGVHVRDMHNVIIYDIKGVKMGESNKINLLCEVFIFMSYWWAIKILLFISLDGNTFCSSNFVNLKRQRIPLTYYWKLSIQSIQKQNNTSKLNEKEKFYIPFKYAKYSKFEPPLDPFLK
jgi:hypothetical protein